MKILYIHQYFKTPEEGGAIRSWYIASDMVKAGHEVEMITAHNKDEYTIREMNGIRVHYLPVRYQNHYGFLRRIYAFLIFAHKAYYLGRKLDNIDFAYITSTPLTVGLIALSLNARDRIPYLFEVRDLWPEAPIQIGALKNPLIKFLARKLEKKVYRNALCMVALSPGIKQHLSAMFPEKPIHLCSNISDCHFFTRAGDEDREIRNKYGLEGKFVISYFGAIGWVNELEYLLKLAEFTEKHGAPLHYLIIGDGARREKLIRDARIAGIRNIDFIDHVNKYDLRKYLTVIDAAYISFARFPVLENNSPNKFFDALASGKLVISNVKGWISDLVVKNDCGFHYDPEKPEEALHQLQPYLKDPGLLDSAKDNARKLALSDFERKKLTGSLLQFLRDRFSPQ